MTPNRRDFLRLLLASAAASTLDVEKLLWVQKPIITVPVMPTSILGTSGTIGAINRATYTFWRNRRFDDLFPPDTAAYRALDDAMRTLRSQ